MVPPESRTKPTILVAPLDWGLGHATRCVPLIRALLALGAHPLIGASGRTRHLLEAEFPQAEFVELKGYDIRYPRRKELFFGTMGIQIPKILARIQEENHWLAALVKQRPIHGVISDNRYGLHHPTVPTVFLTHQLRIRTGLGAAADNLLQRLNYRYIDRFSECWVPDLADRPGLAGDLAHPAKAPAVPVRYLGPLSRFAPGKATTGKELLVLLSGPEPQRTMLEALLCAQLPGIRWTVTLVRGLPGETALPGLGPNVQVFNHLPADALAAVIEGAALVVARSGYSTVMDLAALEKRSILIPTPGQTEQEYLGRHLMAQGWAYCCPQRGFDLPNALKEAERFPYRPFPSVAGTALMDVLSGWIHGLKWD